MKAIILLVSVLAVLALLPLAVLVPLGYAGVMLGVGVVLCLDFSRALRPARGWAR